jgi:hypothetical protein
MGVVGETGGKMDKEFWEFKWCFSVSVIRWDGMTELPIQRIASIKGFAKSLTA